MAATNHELLILWHTDCARVNDAVYHLEERVI